MNFSPNQEVIDKLEDLWVFDLQKRFCVVKLELRVDLY